MKNIVIISEYNLFHNGHKRQYEHLRERYSHEGCRIIAVMSGNFTQRGIPALLPKRERARLAVAEGADLVLELPYPWCCAPAELFARAGVHIASSLGADILCFGSESGDTVKLCEIAARLSSPDFTDALAAARIKASHSGESFIKTRERVYNKLYRELPLITANDILGVEYTRAIHALAENGHAPEPYAMLREGSETATLARGYAAGGELEKLASIAPPSVCEAVARSGCVNSARLEVLVLGHLRLTEPSELAQYADMSFGLACRMCSAARESRTLGEYYAACATKKYTDAQLRRCTLYCLTRVTAYMVRALPVYTSLLAANEAGREFLAATRRSRSFPVISKGANLRALDDAVKESYAFAARADSLYEIISPVAPDAKPYIK